MTDLTGTEEPEHTDEDALKESTPLIPIVPAAAGIAAPAVLLAAGRVDEPDDHGHSHGDGDSHDHDHGASAEGHGGVIERLGDAISGLFGRDKRG